MKNSVDIKELKEVEKNILKGIKLDDSFQDIKIVAGFDIAYIDKKYRCMAVVLDFKTLKEIEVKEVEGDEVMPYSPTLSAFREGPPILDAYRSLQNKPDLLLIKGNGALSKNKVGLASYVGVLVNKPSIGVAKELTFGKLDEDRIVVEGEVRGMGIKAKEFANPIYVSPGHNISLESSVKLIKKMMIGQYKMPLILHLAHKYVNKLKKDKNI